MKQKPLVETGGSLAEIFPKAIDKYDKIIYNYIVSNPLTNMRDINGWVESNPLTNMRDINGWVESNISLAFW